MGSTRYSNRFGLERPYRRQAEFRAAVTRINGLLAFAALLALAALVILNGGA